MLTALTRAPGPSIVDCALSFRPREAIDARRAVEQHRGYEGYLRGRGVRVVALDAAADLPDAVFVEDAAVVVDEVAVLARPRLEARRREVESVAAALAPYRRLERLAAPASLEGGDVLRVGRALYVGLSRRTDAGGVAGLARALAPFGYQVRPVAVTGCLHLKTAVTSIGPGTLLANRAWVDMAPFAGFDVVDVPASEPDAANVLVIGEDILLPASFPRTRDLLRGRGLRVHTLDISELQKAEAGLTCCSIVFDDAAPSSGPPAR